MIGTIPSFKNRPKVARELGGIPNISAGKLSGSRKRKGLLGCLIGADGFDLDSASR
jgi:hypothetical protein